MQATAISSGDGQAFASATASAFGQGNNADGYASAISQGIQQHGCGFYQQSFAQVRFHPPPSCSSGKRQQTVRVKYIGCRIASNAPGRQGLGAKLARPDIWQEILVITIHLFSSQNPLLHLLKYRECRVGTLILSIPSTKTCKLMQAYAIARSNGWDQSFARAAAQSSAINNCFGQFLGFSQADASAEAEVIPPPLPLPYRHHNHTHSYDFCNQTNKTSVACCGQESQDLPAVSS